MTVEQDVIAMLAIGFLLMVAALTWSHHLERQTTYPPIIRPSILTRNKGKVAIVIFVEVSLVEVYIAIFGVNASELILSNVQFLCVCGYGGLIYTSNIFYQRFEDMTPSQLMVRTFSSVIDDR